MKFNFRFGVYFVLMLFFCVLNSIAQIKMNSYKTTSVTYSVVPIPYAACTCSVGTKILPGYDDSWQLMTNIGFNFDYFGKTFNSCTVGANGQITFSTSLSGGYDAWSISGPLPNTSNMPGNTICAVFRDIDPTSSGNMYYSTYGSSPNRFFVVSWCKVPLFSTSCNTVLPRSTFQVIFHETTNCIDVFVENSSSCPLWNSGYGIIGIQDSAGIIGYSPPGRNYPNTWTANNEGWRFVPIGSSCSALTSGPCAISASISDFEKDNYISVFPNPVKDKFFIKKNISFEGNLEIKDVMGRTILKQKMDKNISEVDLNSFESGIYYLKVFDVNKQNIYQSKIVKE